MVSCVACGISHKAKKNGVLFHKFPKKPEQRAVWLNFVNRSETDLPTNCYLCSQHFSEDDFDRSSSKKVQLRKNCVPTISVVRVKYARECDPIFVSDSPTNEPVILSINHEISDDNVSPKIDSPTFEGSHCLVTSFTKKRKLASPIETSINGTPKKRRNSVSLSMTSQEDTPRKRKLREKVRKLSFKNIQQAKKIRKLQKTNWAQKKRIFKLTSVIKELQNKSFFNYDHSKSIIAQFGDNEELINRLFNKTTGKKVTKSYCKEIRSFAITLHYFSAKAYNYVRQRFHNCLPHVKTLSKWYSVIDADPGLTVEALSMLKVKVQNSNKPLLCSLVMDEMSLREIIEFDGTKYHGYVNFGVELEKTENVPANKALVFMVVAINESWKIPVGYFFIQSINSHQKSQLILQCISALTECGLTICNITYDGCATNFSMSELLGCSFNNLFKMETGFLTNCGNLVYIMPDPSHMIKLVRNLFGDRKIIIDGNGNIINFKYLDELIALQESEGLHIANKIRKQHVNYFKQKMKVKLATQLLSRSVADSLKFCRDILKLDNFADCEATIKFIIIMNDAFDILNSRKLNEFGYKKALCSMNQSKIEKFSYCFINYIATLKFSNGQKIIESNRRTGLLGIAICFQSLDKIYNKYLNGSNPILKFLPVYKCSQDHLELFFSSIRSHGGNNNNPSCLNFKAAYKKILIHAEIREGGVGNCVPLHQINILNCTSQYKKLEDIINDTNRIYNITEDELQNVQDVLQDHDYLDVLNNLSQFCTEVVNYIAGFVARNLGKKIKCESCVSALFGKKHAFFYPLIDIKNRGGLSYPSEDVVKICLKSEQALRYELSKTVYPKIKKELISINVLKTFINDGSIFQIIKTHAADNSPLENHIVLLIKAIIENYFNLRIRYACKNITASEKIRSYYTNLIQFHGQ